MSVCLEPISLCLSVDVFGSAPPLQVRDRLPHLKAIVQYKGKLSQEYPNVYEVTPLHTPHAHHMDACAHTCTCCLHDTLFGSQWEDFLKLGDEIETSVVEEKIKAQKPEHCALLIYTVS